MPASRLAAELGVSPRTIYRDIATLVAQGAPIDGEAGVGYVLRPGFVLPPLMFAQDEIDALMIGLRMVATLGDPALEAAADNVLAKVLAVLPPDRQDANVADSFLAAAGLSERAPPFDQIRLAFRHERKLWLRYTDKGGAGSERMVWPVALGFFHGSEVLAAWCELRRGFRHFRLDRIAEARLTDHRLPTRRRLLLVDWRLQEGLDATS